MSFANHLLWLGDVMFLEISFAIMLAHPNASTSLKQGREGCGELNGEHQKNPNSVMFKTVGRGRLGKMRED